MRSFAIATALLAATVSAQQAGTGASATNGTSKGTGVDHVVMVGQDGLAYTPNQVTAAVGDTVTFQFSPGANGTNHTVTQSAFATPCTFLTNSTTNQVGFDSGFVPVPKGSTQMPSWTLQVQVSTPLWAYCKQGKHCQAGMVFGINVNNTGPKSMDAFIALAKASGNSTAGAAAGGTGNGTSTSTSTAGGAGNGTSSGASTLFASSGVAFTVAAIAAALA